MKKIFAFALAALTLFATSCVKDKMYSGVTFAKVENTVAYSINDKVEVVAELEALVEIKSAKLFYKGGNDASYKGVDMLAGTGRLYMGTIPGYDKDIEVSYYIVAETDVITESKKFTYTVGQVPVDYTGLVLNELNGNDKFIELYNGGDHDIFIGGITMFKDGGSDAKWTAPEENLAKGAYLLLYSEDVTGSGGAQEGYPEKYTFHSGLSAKKSVRIHITKPDGTTIIDDFNLDNSGGTKYTGSFGRNADGGWYHQTTKTPNAVNVDGTEKLTMIK